MQVEVYIEDEEDPIGGGEWAAVPQVGQLFYHDKNHYTVTEVAWGMCVRGNGEPLWNKPCCTITISLSNTKM